MPQKLPYGTGSTLWIDIPADSLVADFSRVPGDVLDDPSAAVSAALLDPIGYPSITRTVVPGDRVVIALDPAVPRADAVVAGVLDALMHAAVLAEDIVVLTTRAGRGDRYRTGRLPVADGDVTTIVHDPDDKANLAYLAASKHAEPIYLNRHLCEADVIIPIGLARPRRSLGYTGRHGGLYPVFADEAARGRLRAPSSATETVERRRRRAEADEVAWLLGLQLIVQIVPGPGDSVLHALAGTVAEVERRGLELAEAAWSHTAPVRADLVVAAIAGDVHDQNWESFARALHAVSHLCTDQGTIVLCTGLTCRPGPALQRLTGPLDDAQLRHQLHRDRSEDAVSASLLLRARARRHIYLLSGLDATSVEALGIGYIESPEQVAHLSRQFSSCILVADAHRTGLGRDGRDGRDRRDGRDS